MTASLLAADEPDPVTVLRADGVSPLFLTADHAGRHLPRALRGLGVSEAERARHIGWDIGIEGVTRHLAEALDATAVIQNYSRLVIDCNRDPAWPSAFPAVSEFTPIPGNEHLTEADRAARVRAIFSPYHGRITALLDQRAAAGRPSVVVAMHSFTPVFKGQSRTMHAGVLHNRDFGLAHIMLTLLRAEPDIVVGDNEPYAITEASDYGIPTHGAGRGLRHVELEIRQDLITEPAGQRAWAERLARLLPMAVDRLRV